MTLNREEKVLKYFKRNNKFITIWYILFIIIVLIMNIYFLFFKPDVDVFDILTISLVTSFLLVSLFIYVKTRNRNQLSDYDYEKIVDCDYEDIYKYHIKTIENDDLITAPIITISPCLYKGSDNIIIKKAKNKKVFYSQSKYSFLVFLQDHIFYSQYHINHITGSHCFYNNRYIYYKDILGYGHKSDVLYKDNIYHDTLTYHITLNNKEDFIFDIRDEIAMQNDYRISCFYYMYLKNKLYVFVSLEILISIIILFILTFLTSFDFLINTILMILYLSNILLFYFLKIKVRDCYEPKVLTNLEKDTIIEIDNTIKKERQIKKGLVTL